MSVKCKLGIAVYDHKRKYPYCRSGQKYAQYENSCAQRNMFVPLAIEILGSLSRTLKKSLLCMSLLADSRNQQSVGPSIAFDRAVQSFFLFIVTIRGSATMLLSRAP